MRAGVLLTQMKISKALSLSLSLLDKKSPSLSLFHLSKALKSLSQIIDLGKISKALSRINGCEVMVGLVVGRGGSLDGFVVGVGYGGLMG